MHRALETIDTLIVHCADTPNGVGRWTIRDIDDWHRERGFHRSAAFLRPDVALRHVGYHRVIHVDGSIGYGRELEEVGAHAAGNNHQSIGICLIGRDAYTPVQWTSLASETEMLLRQLGRLVIIGHRDVEPAKTCPGFEVREWVRGGFAPLPGHIYGDGE